MSNAISNPWRSYADTRPGAAGVYEWRIPSVAVTGLVVTFAAHMRKRGAGYRDVISPSFDYWDGYRVSVPAGTEWRECGPVDVEEYTIANLAIEGLSFSACIHCGKTPTLKGVQRTTSGVSIGGDPHRLNSWWLTCCQWGATPHLSDPREIERIRRAALTAAAADARRGAIEEAAAYHDKNAADAEGDGKHVAAGVHRHYAKAIRALTAKEGT